MKNMHAATKKPSIPLTQATHDAPSTPSYRNYGKVALSVIVSTAIAGCLQQLSCYTVSGLFASERYSGQAADSLSSTHLTAPSSSWFSFPMAAASDIASSVNLEKQINADNKRSLLQTIETVSITPASVEFFELGRVVTADRAYDIKLQNNLAYVTVDTAGLQVFDITDSANPTLVGSYATTGATRHIDISGNLAYVAASDEGLLTLDISDVTNITSVNTQTFTHPVTKLAVANDVIFTANHNNPSIAMVDRAQPANDVIAATYSHDRGVTDIYRHNQWGYIGFPGIGVIQVDTTSFPKTNTLTLTGETKGSAAYGNTLIVASGSAGIHFVDITNPSAPQLISQLPLSGTAESVTLYNNYAYIPAGTAGVHCIDLSGAPQLVNTYNTAGYAKGLYIRNNKAYIANGLEGLHISDITQPTNPQFLGSYNTTGTAEAIYVESRERIAYLADGEGGLQLLDVRISTQPAKFGEYLTGGYTHNLLVDDTIIYIADGKKGTDDGLGLAIFEASDPYNPKLFVTYSTPDARDLHRIDNVVYLSDATDGLYILDIDGLSQAWLLGQFGIPTDRFIYYQNTAYLSTETNTLEILKTPNWDSWLPTTTAMRIAATDTHAYITTFERTLHVYDIQNQTQPVQLAVLENLAGSARDMTILGSNLYISEGPSGIEAISIENPENPASVGQVTTPIDTRGLTSRDNKLYLAADKEGLIIYQTNVQPRITQHHLTLNAGETQIITSASLTVVDPDNTPGELTLTVTNPSHLQFQATSNPGVALNSFTYQQLTNGEIQIIHDGTNLAPDYTLQVSDGRLNDGPYHPGLHFNNPPQWVNHQLHVVNGGDQLITSQTLQATLQSGIPDNAQIIFNTDTLTHGHFAYQSDLNTPITQFSQQAIVDNTVSFVHDSSGIVPAITLSVSQPDTYNSENTRAMSITFSNINTPPRLILNPLYANEGETFILTTDTIRAIDDNLDTELLFEIRRMSRGRFSHTGKFNQINPRFTQALLKAGGIQFSQSGGSQNQPYYDITVTDGAFTTDVVRAELIINLTPVIQNNTLSIHKGATVILTPKDLSASDPDSNHDTLRFEIQDLTHGYFSYANENNGTQINSFYQDNITKNVVHFTHDNTNEAPTYSVIVRDDRNLASTNDTAIIDFNNPDVGKEIPAGNIIGPVAGGIGIAALLGAGLFIGCGYRQDTHSRQKHPFAAAVYNALKPEGAANFKSGKGKRFVEAIDVLIQALSDNAIQVDNLPADERHDLAGIVADEARNKINPAVNCLKESVITPDDIEEAASTIASAVAMRWGDNQPPQLRY